MSTTWKLSGRKKYERHDHISVRLITWNDQHDYREFTQYLMKKLSSFTILQPRIWLTKRDKQLKERHAPQNITTLSDDMQDHTAKYREKCYELQTRKTSEWKKKSKHVLSINFTFLLKISRRGRPRGRNACRTIIVCKIFNTISMSNFYDWWDRWKLQLDILIGRIVWCSRIWFKTHLRENILCIWRVISCYLFTGCAKRNPWCRTVAPCNQ